MFSKLCFMLQVIDKCELCVAFRISSIAACFPEKDALRMMMRPHLVTLLWYTHSLRQHWHAAMTDGPSRRLQMTDILLTYCLHQSRGPAKFRSCHCSGGCRHAPCKPLPGICLVCCCTCPFPALLPCVARHSGSQVWDCIHCTDASQPAH